jgi:prolyl oligopeptidase
MAETISYPTTRTMEHVDTFFGVEVNDPYRWLEDANAPETKEWVEAQNKVTFDYLEQLPQRESFKARLTELWNYEKRTAPFQKGGRYFYSRNDGLQNQNVWYVADNYRETGRILINPNELSTDGTMALSGLSVSKDGKYASYGISSAGSDWQEWRVRDVESGEDLSDLIRWCKFTSMAWTPDGKGFFYSRYPEPQEEVQYQQITQGQQIYYHRLGDPQDNDALIYERPDKTNWYIGASVTDDGKYLIISAREGTSPKNGLFVKDLTAPDSDFRELFGVGIASHAIIENDQSLFYVYTQRDAPRGKVVAVELDNPAAESWRTIVPESNDTLEGVTLLQNEFFLNYLHDAYTAIRVYDLEGKFVRDLPLPGIGTVNGVGGDRKDTEAFYVYSSFTTPPTTYRLNLTTGENEFVRQDTPAGFSPEGFVTEQVFVTSKDGTRVPLFLIHKKGLKRDGENPTILYGYGGFSISLTPGFSISRLAWVEKGGIYAVANLRGGNEYGEEWHEAGMRLKKQNVFDDFIAAAEYLIQEKFTSPEHLAIFGGSNGGLLVGAVANQRPELFACALPAVGVMDMLRFHKFTVGWGWIADYGSPDESEEMFRSLYSYSPYHNVVAGTRYPATMVTTSDHDDRVVPAHSFKYAAALQAAQSSLEGNPPPTLIRIETRAGHGAGKPTAKIIEETADIYAFAAAHTGI